MACAISARCASALPPIPGPRAPPCPDDVGPENGLIVLPLETLTMSARVHTADRIGFTPALAPRSICVDDWLFQLNEERACH